MINLCKSTKMKLMRKGFTLIELLIVIAIIGFLSALFVNTYLGDLKKGRDARRKSDIELIRQGIETYKADCNIYPASLPSGGGQLRGTGAGALTNCLAANVYINLMPSDPVSTDRYVYTQINGGTAYQICSTLESPPVGSPAVSCRGSTSSCGATCYYQAVNP